MRQKVGPTFLQCVAFSVALLASREAAALQDIPFRASASVAPEPLETETVWRFDRYAENPHRTNWALRRQVRTTGIKAVPVDDKFFRPVIEGVVSDVAVHVRNSPRRYFPMSRFPCTREPLGAFAMQPGAIKAGQDAASRWNELLKASVDALAVRTGRIRADSAEKALRIAAFQFKEWQRDLEEKWRGTAEGHARAAEWKYYQGIAAQLGTCKGGPKPELAVRWEEVMDPPPAKVASIEPVVRVPARRINGIFAIRATIEVGGLRLNGQFIVDTSSPHSLISPSWLESQGMNPRVLEAFSQASRTVRWEGGTATGKRVIVDSLEIASYPFDLDEFYLVETKMFLPPRSVSPCCDGVLGRDFLIDHPIEFNPGTERDFVRIFARSGFAQPAQHVWVETGTEAGALVSQCEVESKGQRPLEGVTWLTASNTRLTAGPAAPKGWGGASASVRCGQTVLAQAQKAEISRERLPGKAGAGIGMALLSRGVFTLDLPHGRLWFAKDSLLRAPESNRSGLVLDFTLEKGERTLRVKDIRPQTPAASTLLREGIRPGAEIVEINGKDASDLDLWQANRFLTGAKGEQVVLRVRRDKDSDKIVPLKLKP